MNSSKFLRVARQGLFIGLLSVGTHVNANEPVPAYSQLAYIPEKATRVIDMPEEYFTVQLLAVSTKQQVEDFVEAHDLYDMVAVQIIQREKTLYVLLPGVYTSRADAEDALNSLPDGVKAQQPWVRSLQSLHKAMRKPNTHYLATED